MAYKDWRPENWDEIKGKILHKAEIITSRIADKLIEETASEILNAYDEEQFMEDASDMMREKGWTSPS